MSFPHSSFEVDVYVGFDLASGLISNHSDIYDFHEYYENIEKVGGCHL